MAQPNRLYYKRVFCVGSILVTLRIIKLWTIRVAFSEKDEVSDNHAGIGGSLNQVPLHQS